MRAAARTASAQSGQTLVGRPAGASAGASVPAVSTWRPAAASPTVFAPAVSVARLTIACRECQPRKLVIAQRGWPTHGSVVLDGAQPAPGLPRQADPLVDHEARDPLLLVLAADAKLAAVVEPIALVGADVVHGVDQVVRRPPLIEGERERQVVRVARVGRAEAVSQSGQSGVQTDVDQVGQPRAGRCPLGQRAADRCTAAREARPFRGPSPPRRNRRRARLALVESKKSARSKRMTTARPTCGAAFETMLRRRSNPWTAGCTGRASSRRCRITRCDALQVRVRRADGSAAAAALGDGEGAVVERRVS